jgi:archaemetzincin
MNSKKGCIGVVAIGEVPTVAPRDISSHIQKYLDLPSVVLPPLQHPIYAYDERRQQYNAAVILNAFESMPDHGCDKVIGVLNVDLFIPVFTYVLGEAQEGGKFALASMYRLRSGSKKFGQSMVQVLDRLTKVALHEIGHLFEVAHCMNEKCLMHYSSDLRDLDAINLSFCSYCSMYFSDSIRRHKVFGAEQSLNSPKR